MAAGILEIYIAINLVILTLCGGVGALVLRANRKRGVLRANRKRGALIGAIVGMLVGPIVTNLFFFDWFN